MLDPICIPTMVCLRLTLQKLNMVGSLTAGTNPLLFYLAVFELHIHIRVFFLGHDFRFVQQCAGSSKFSANRIDKKVISN